MSALTSLGVQAETVRQLNEMKVYLLRQFGLDLSVCREISVAPVSGVHGQMNMSVPHLHTGGSHSLGGPAGPYGQSPTPYGSTLLPRHHAADEVTFMIPSANVGGIIGKGGQMLKDLQSEFGIRIYVEKEMQGSNSGMRTVVLAAQTTSGMLF
jgi:hypothetical protein